MHCEGAGGCSALRPTRREDAQHPKYAGSEFHVGGLGMDALDAVRRKGIMETEKSLTKQAESLATVAQTVERAGTGRREPPV